MSAVTFLLGLLVLSYLGSGLLAKRSARGLGLPSGAEYVVLGFVLGPHALSVISRALLETFQPVIVCGIGWLGFVLGTSFLPLHHGRGEVRRLLFGAVAALAVAGVVAAAMLWPARRLSADAVTLVLGFGMACAEATRHSVRWVSERHGARGPLSELAASWSKASPIATLLLLGWIDAAAAGAGPTAWLEGLGRFGTTVGFGVVLGLTAALLLGRELRLQNAWSLLLGTALLGMGAAAALGLSPPTTMLAMGLALSIGSRHRRELHGLVAATETPVLLPLLMVLGASVDLRLDPALAGLVAAALAVKLLARVAVGWAATLGRGPARQGAWLGLGLTAAGGFTAAAALGLSRAQPAVGGPVLLLAAVSIVLGEGVGPLALRRALAEAGELTAVPVAAAPPQPVAPAQGST